MHDQQGTKYSDTCAFGDITHSSQQKPRLSSGQGVTALAQTLHFIKCHRRKGGHYVLLRKTGYRQQGAPDQDLAMSWVTLGCTEALSPQPWPGFVWHSEVQPCLISEDLPKNTFHPPATREDALTSPQDSPIWLGVCPWYNCLFSRWAGACLCALTGPVC